MSYPTNLPKPPEWVQDALCASMGADVFFPAVGRNDLMAIAKRTCGLCDVRAQCLEYAMENKDQNGVWGGLSPDERFLLRRRQRKAEAA